jgi:hypothetical protein
MAVDTRNKRASCLSMDGRRGRVWPNPDASLANQADRQQMGLIYPGILSAGAPTGLGAGKRLMLLGAGCAAWMVLR